LINYI